MLVVMGLAGAGKTSILNGVLKRKPKIDIINYGDIAFDIALKKKIVKNRDEILSIPISNHLELQDKVVSKLEDKGKTILDTHAVLRRSPSGFIAGLHPPIFEKFKFEGFVFIDADTNEIIKRKKADTTRTTRPMISKEKIDEDRFLSKLFISNYATRTGSPIYFIINKQNRLNDSINEFIKIIEFLGW